MESIQYYQPYQYVQPPKRISAKAVARSLFIEERTLCFLTGYYLKPYISNEFRLLDCTMGGDNAHNAFHKTSIPTSAFLDTTNLLIDTTAKYPNGYPTKDQVTNAMQKLGIQKSDTIVLYCQPHKDSSMTRVYHILDSYGFEDVSILDGGLLKFTQDGYPTTPGVDYTGPESEITDLRDPSINLIKMDEIVEFALGKRPNMQLIDARDAVSFDGHAPDNIPGCRQGHVPGAINIPATMFINESDDTFKTYKELVQLLKSYNIDPQKDIVVMCRTGISATIAYMGLVFAQYTGMRLYDGSWSEYGSNDTPSLKVAPKIPFYYQPSIAPTPYIIVLPSGEQYMAIKDDSGYYPVYQK